MTEMSLRSEDGLGFGVAVVLHLLVAAALIYQWQWGEQPTFGGDGAISVTLGDGMAEAGGAAALGLPDAIEFIEQPAVSEPLPSEAPRPTPVTETPERPKPDTSRRTETRRQTTTQSSRQQRQTDRKQQQSNSRGSDTGQQKGKQDTGFGEAFGGGTSTGSTAQAKADIKVSIANQVLPYWNSCRVSGLDIDQLSATVTFRMDRSGNIIDYGTPRVSGQNASNAAQVPIFERCVTRSLRQVRRFTGLPEDRYDLWSSYTFDFVKR